MTPVPAAPEVIAAPSAFAALALGKLTRVLGPEQGQRVFQHTLVRAGLADLLTADDLYNFAQHLSAGTGFEAAVGGLLGVAALLRGATGDRN